MYLDDYGLNEDKLHEECGVVGVYTDNPDIASQLIYYGLFALQHRGQESAGIAINTGKKNRISQGYGIGCRCS